MQRHVRQVRGPEGRGRPLFDFLCRSNHAFSCTADQGLGIQGLADRLGELRRFVGMVRREEQEGQVNARGSELAADVPNQLFGCRVGLRLSAEGGSNAQSGR